MTVSDIPGPPPGARPDDSEPPALQVEDLELAYVVRGIRRPVLRGVSFEIKAGESYGLVGESGCGKSTTAYAAVRYLPRNAVITGGRILIDGSDVTGMSDDEVRRFRTHEASMVYQDPGAALNPTTKIGPQVVKAQNGKMTLTATCLGDARCQAVLTARIDVRNGGLGGQIFRVDPGATKNLVFTFRPEVRTWLKSHPRSSLVIEARTSNEDYDVVWRGTFRLRLVA